MLAQGLYLGRSHSFQFHLRILRRLDFTRDFSGIDQLSSSLEVDFHLTVSLQNQELSEEIQLGLINLMEKAMAPHSSTLAWKIPWTEEPGRLQSLGSQRVRHD